MDAKEFGERLIPKSWKKDKTREELIQMKALAHRVVRMTLRHTEQAKEFYDSLNKVVCD